MPYKFNDNMHTYGNRQTHSHIGHTPAWFFPVRILQGILAIVTLALSAFVINEIDEAYDDYEWNGLGLNIFTSILTFAFLAYVFLTAFKFVRAYNMWAVLGLEIACVIFWLVTFALLADHAKDGNNAKKATRLEDYLDLGTRDAGEATNGLRDYLGLDTRNINNAINSLTAAAVLSAINFLLFCITLAFFALNLHRHRSAGHPFTPGGGAGTTSGGTDHKMQNVNPATGTQQLYGDAGVVNQPGDQQYPQPAYNQPNYNQQGHQNV